MFDPWVGKIPWRRKWQPTPLSLPRKFHGEKSLVDCSPWCRKEPGTTEQLTLRALNKETKFQKAVTQNHVFSPREIWTFIHQRITNEFFFFFNSVTALEAQVLKGPSRDPSGPSYKLPDWREPHGEMWWAVSLHQLQKENLEAASV